MKTVATSDESGRWILSKTNKPLRPDRANFVIKSHYGAYDWSGFRTFEDCLVQVLSKHPAGFYIIVEDC